MASHGADIGLEAVSADYEGSFGEGARGLTALLTDPLTVGPAGEGRAVHGRPSVVAASAVSMPSDTQAT